MLFSSGVQCCFQVVFNVVFKWCSLLFSSGVQCCFQVVFNVVVEVAVNKTRIGLRIGSDRVPYRIGLESSLSVQNHYFEKSCSNNDTGGSEFFFRVACVTNKKNRFSYITRLKIHHQIENYRKDGLRMPVKCLESW